MSGRSCKEGRYLFQRKALAKKRKAWAARLEKARKRGFLRWLERTKGERDARREIREEKRKAWRRANAEKLKASDRKRYAESAVRRQQVREADQRRRGKNLEQRRAVAEMLGLSTEAEIDAYLRTQARVHGGQFIRHEGSFAYDTKYAIDGLCVTRCTFSRWRRMGLVPKSPIVKGKQEYYTIGMVVVMQRCLRGVKVKREDYGLMREKIMEEWRKIGVKSISE